MVQHRIRPFNPLYDKMKVRLEYTNTRPLNAIAFFSTDTIGLFDPLGKTPKYWTQMFALYRFAFIHQVTVHIEMSNIGLNPFSCVIAETNTTDYPGATMPLLAQTPRAQYKQVITGGNHSVAILHYQTSGEAVTGTKRYEDEQYWTTLATPPSVAYLPILAVGFEPTLGGASPFNSILMYRIWYDVEFATLKPL